MSNVSRAAAGTRKESPPVLGSTPSGIVSRITPSLAEVVSPEVSDPAVLAPVVSPLLAPVVSPELAPVVRSVVVPVDAPVVPVVVVVLSAVPVVLLVLVVLVELVVPVVLVPVVSVVPGIVAAVVPVVPVVHASVVDSHAPRESPWPRWVACADTSTKTVSVPLWQRVTFC